MMGSRWVSASDVSFCLSRSLPELLEDFITCKVTAKGGRIIDAERTGISQLNQAMLSERILRQVNLA